MIGKVPRNYSNDFDRRKQKMDEITAHLLPDVTTEDAGKIMKVSEDGAWIIGSDENTIIEANPDEQPTVDLENLKIGSTVYSVKNPELTSIKSFKLTMSNGGQYNTNKPIIEFFNEAGQKASITSSDYTVECDKTYAGNAGMDQVCSISTPDTPGTFTYTFVNDFDIENYNLIKLTRGGTFLNDIAKNIKIELSADGENYITIYDETTITWSDAVPYHLISLKDGSEASTLLPIVTSADNGKVLSVINGAWNKGDISSIPTPPSDKNGRFLITKDGNWAISRYPSFIHLVARLNSSTATIIYYVPTQYQFGMVRGVNGEVPFVVISIYNNDNSQGEVFYLSDWSLTNSQFTLNFKNLSGTHSLTASGASLDYLTTLSYT